MSISLRTPSSLFLGVPPIFFKRRQAPAKRREPVMARPAAAAPVKPATPKAVDFDKLLASTRKTPVELAPIEWQGDVAAPGALAPAACDNAAVMDCADSRARRIRDRYISARFPGVARSAADLECVERVVKCARLYFEDGQLAAALELLDMAIEQDSRAEALWLAELEILFLARDRARFVECARAFRALHAGSGEWPEVARLGHALAPGEALFGAKGGPRDHDHYGPWPDLPNWIQANWDLTSEVLGADFHRLLKGAP